MTTIALPSLDLAALLCSRVCHDVIGPVSAIINGLELLEIEEDEAMRASALDLIAKSAKSASTKLQFCRLAFGASGSAGSEIETGEAESVARGLIDGERTKLTWAGSSRRVAKNKLKLLLNLCVLAAGCVPRGGVVAVQLAGEGGDFGFTLEAKGTNPRVPPHMADLLEARPEGGPIDAHAIQAYYAGMLARDSDMAIALEADVEGVAFRVRPMGEATLPASGAAG